MSEADEARRPDLVLIVTDQQRHDQLGYSSGGHFATPNLDALAENGVIFETAYSASAVCVPSRTALLTGLQPHRVPTQDNGLALREGFWTVAHELRAAGYETALIGKMHFSPVHSEHGFETMRLNEHIRWQGTGPLAAERNDELDDYHDWLLDQGLDDYRFSNPESMPSDYPRDAHPTSWIEREVTEFLALRESSRPLFLVISFPHPHAPYDPPEPYASMYDPSDSVLPSSGYEVNEKLPLVFQLATLASKTQVEAADTAQLRRFLALVRGLVKQIDDAIGRLVPQLGLDHTVVFFTSDHGDFAGWRGLMGKNPWIPFDDLARVPLFVTGNGITGGRRVPHLVQSCDVALTCLDYAGIPTPPNIEFDTRSLRPFLDGTHGPEDLDRTVACGTTITWPTVRRGRFKLLEHSSLQAEPVFFDLETDPLESVNLADDPAYRDVVTDLAVRLRECLARPIVEIPAPAPAQGPGTFMSREEPR